MIKLFRNEKNKAVAFVYPTLYEGFGLPILEAMACETVVLSANNSSLPEVYGKAAISFDAKDEDSIANGMELLLKDESVAKNLINASKEQIKKFNWDITASEVVKLFKEIQ